MKKMKKSNILIIFIFSFLFIGQLSAQERNCGTMIYLENQIEKDSSLNQRMNDNEIRLQSWIKSNANQKVSNVITIPVVVHVVYNTNAENILDNQIQSQIDILNEDFRRLNTDAANTPSSFQSLAADTEIEFCLASTDPNGNSTTGITRTSTSQSSFSTNNGVKYSSSGGIDAWNTSEYLNIWVCDISGGILGYAQFPGGNATSDGVVCDYAYFGNIGTATTPYHLGRTATHEVGHWLNLRHIWGDSNCGDDFCNDTPEHSGSNYGCPSFPSISANCNGNGSSGDMFMNYMDYTDDACMNIFTNDQKTRMIASINTSRAGLITSIGCQGGDYGCTDSLAYNYSVVAIIDNGNCCYISGCTDPLAFNYDSAACFDNSSCIATILGCTNPTASNFDPNSNTGIAFGGALDNTFGTGGYFTGNQHLIFDATKACVIKSAVIYAQVATSITFELRDNASNIIDDTTLSVVIGQQRLDLSFDVPVSTNLQLGISGNNSGIYRNNSNPSYPYDIASAINITGSSASQSGYYYFFYDIEVEIACLNSTINASWDCNAQGNCYDPGTGTGQYSSLVSCQSSCLVPSWDCDGQGNCSDPATGLGQYTSLSSCLSSCLVPSWDCNAQGNCYDPGTGTGQYSSLVSCQSSCLVPSWDCDGQGNCSDPATGLGQYTSLSSCQSSCLVPSWDCVENACVDPGTGVGIYSSLTACNQACGVSALEEHTTTKALLKITDILGRETNEKRNKLLFYIYDDGTVEKKIVIE